MNAGLSICEGHHYRFAACGTASRHFSQRTQTFARFLPLRSQAACLITVLRRHASTIHWGTEDDLKKLGKVEDRAHEELLKVAQMLNQALNIEQVKLLQANRDELHQIKALLTADAA